MLYDLTVIIPVYNAEKYIARCLDSIINQMKDDYKVRIICVNDGSGDGSDVILDEYSQKFEFINVFSQLNGGPSKACNTGLTSVEDTRYVAFLDADDFIAENYLHEFYRYINEDYDMLYFDINLISQSGEFVKVIKFNDVKVKNDLMVMKPARWSKIYKSELFTNIVFPNGIIYEDLAVTPCVVSRTQSIKYIEYPLVNYIIDTTGSIMNTTKRNIFDIFPALDYLDKLLGRLNREELHYLYLEHLCVGHTYRLLGYNDVKKNDFSDIVKVMEEKFGKKWNKNKYIKQGVQKITINSLLSHVVPIFLILLKYMPSSFWVLIAKLIRRMKKGDE